MLTVRGLSEAYARGETTPLKVTEDLLKKIESLNPTLNCFITVLKDSAMEQAGDAERKMKEGQRTGPLQGVPVALKDLIYIDGVRCTAGSKILASHVANYDSPVAKRLKAAGAVILGTTNMHEFAAGVTNDNPHYGPVRNPWDTTRISGGSSGGSAAAVSAGLAAAAIGTDTAGSVRIPAALCGVFGLKPTYGLISRIGVIPLASSFDTVGTLTNSAWDAGALLGVLAGHEEGDVTTADIPPSDYTGYLEQPLGKTRIGVPRKFFMDVLDGSSRDAFSKFLDQLTSLGCEVASTELADVDKSYDTWLPIRRAEASAFHEGWLKSTPEMYGEDVRKGLELGIQVTATRYINAQNSRPALRESFSTSMESFDFLAVPTTCVPATKIGETSVSIEGKDVDLYSALNRLTLPFNVVGFPAISVPIGFSGGLPVGAQLVARPFREPELLRIANAYGEKFGPFQEPPFAPAKQAQ